MARPGIMIYFDIRKPLSWLPNEDKGRLLDAILEYGEFGVLPEFEGMLGMAWGFIQPRLDKDYDSYENSKAQRQYASFCKKRSGNGLRKLSFEEWLEMDDEERKFRATTDNEMQRPVVPVNGPITVGNDRTTEANGSVSAGAFRDPSTSSATSTATSTATATSTSTATATSTSTATSTAAATGTSASDGADAPDAAAAARENKLEFIRGELGKGVVKLTPFQFDLLLDRLGVDMFDHYIRKLADYIIKTGASPGNHFKLIMKWADEDSSAEG